MDDVYTDNTLPLVYQRCLLLRLSWLCWRVSWRIVKAGFLLHDAMHKRGLCHHAVSICQCPSVCHINIV